MVTTDHGSAMTELGSQSLSVVLARLPADSSRDRPGYSATDSVGGVGSRCEASLSVPKVV